ncbi:hypothetical protein D3C75_570760 [compost metagenome]
MLLAGGQLAGQFDPFALPLDVLMMESLPVEIQLTDALGQLRQYASHLGLALAIGMLLGAAERAGSPVLEHVAMLLEAGHGAGLLQGMARLLPLGAEPRQGGLQLIALGGEPGQLLLERADLLPQSLLLFAVIATRLCQLQQLPHPRQLLGAGLTLLLRPGNLGVPLLRLHLIVLQLQMCTLLLPMVALLLPLLEASLQIAQGMTLVLTTLQQTLQQRLVLGPVLHGRQQGLPLARQRGQRLAFLEPARPLPAAILERLRPFALLLPLLLQLELQGPRLRALLLDLLQLAGLLPDAGIEILCPLEFGLQGPPLPLGAQLVRQQLLLAQGGLLLRLRGQLKLGSQLADKQLLLLHFQSEAGEFVVIGAGHLGLLGAGKLFPPGRRLAVGRLGGGQRLLPLPAGLQLGGNPSVEIPQVLQQLTLLLLVLEAGGEV